MEKNIARQRNVRMQIIPCRPALSFNYVVPRVIFFPSPYLVWISCRHALGVRKTDERIARVALQWSPLPLWTRSRNADSRLLASACDAYVVRKGRYVTHQADRARRNYPSDPSTRAHGTKRAGECSAAFDRHRLLSTMQLLMHRSIIIAQARALLLVLRCTVPEDRRWIFPIAENLRHADTFHPLRGLL